MAFILENLGLTPAISIVGVFYRSYKVHLSIKKGSKTTTLYTYSYDKVSKNALFGTYIPFILIICRSSHLYTCLIKL